ncbi:MAG TPA: PilN domain-containing protein [Candidatus Methylomirabilis sp.]|nr:PilN domain-containing protein [Candidatus Methylomirabilis sp.]
MIKINLAPPTAKTRSVAADVHLGVVFGALAVLLVVGPVLYALVLSVEIRHLQRDVERDQREITRLKPIIAEGQRYRQEKEELERRVSAIEMVARNQTRPAYLLDALADTLPADLWLTRIEEKSQQLRLSGSTYSSVTLADFMANLKASGKFTEVDLLESRQDLAKPTRTITFEVMCQFGI